MEVAFFNQTHLHLIERDTAVHLHVHVLTHLHCTALARLAGVRAPAACRRCPVPSDAVRPPAAT